MRFCSIYKVAPAWRQLFGGACVLRSRPRADVVALADTSSFGAAVLRVSVCFYVFVCVCGDMFALDPHTRLGDDVMNNVGGSHPSSIVTSRTCVQRDIHSHTHTRAADTNQPAFDMRAIMCARSRESYSKQFGNWIETFRRYLYNLANDDITLFWGNIKIHDIFQKYYNYTNLLDLRENEKNNDLDRLKWNNFRTVEIFEYKIPNNNFM